MTDEAFRREIRNLGAEISPEVIAACVALYSQLALDPARSPVRVERDIAYGSHERHRLDIFSPGEGRDLPVLVYVHGGGFVGGDKTLPGAPFYGNIGAWSVRQGFVGVTMTYRLAPENPWPAGAEDVAKAVAWLRQNIADRGGSPRRIFIAGQSAGAAHVASYLAMTQLHDAARPVAGAIMFSGIYDVTTLEKGPLELSYYGADDNIAERQSALDGLVASQVPMLFTVAEYDPLNFQKQAAVLVERWFSAKQALPRLLYLPDANHMSAALGLGDADRFLSPEVAAFVSRFSPAP